METIEVSLFMNLLNDFGMVAFAASGSIAALKHEGDLFGAIFLALVASTCGGITRDLLIGAVPPEVMLSTFPLFLATGVGVLTYFFFPFVCKYMEHPIAFFDALGLGVFAVYGAGKAMDFGIMPVWSIGLGVITAVGGGALRDMMLAQTPFILKKEIYATASILGAAILVAGCIWVPHLREAAMLTGALACTALRLLALRYGWNMR